MGEEDFNIEELNTCVKGFKGGKGGGKERGKGRGREARRLRRRETECVRVCVCGFGKGMCRSSSPLVSESRPPGLCWEWGMTGRRLVATASALVRILPSDADESATCGRRVVANNDGRAAF